ncbi:MAG: ABC transporter permease [Bacteroidota bacterium]
MPSQAPKDMYSPPRWLDKLLERFCAPHLLEEVIGDLHERYYLKAQKIGEAKARKWYWREVLAYMRPTIFKRQTSPHSKPIITVMIQSYFKIAFRNIARNKAFSAINILGLVLGMVCSLLIFLWIQDERSIDNFHTNGEHLYRVYTRNYNSEYLDVNYKTSALLPEELKTVIPEIQYASGFAKELRLSRPGDIQETFQVGDKIHKMKGSRAGADFFKMFSYPLLLGTAENAIAELKGIAISRKMANLFFESPEAAYGKTITFRNESSSSELIVTAVFEDIPNSSSDQFDYLTNWDDWVQNDDFKRFWDHLGTHTYIQLQAGVNPAEVEEKLKNFLDSYLDFPEDRSFYAELGLQKFGDQYLNSNFENGRPSGGRKEYVQLLGAVAIFILLIACINFMNLTTARSIKRAKEVGMRKVVGAVRWSLITQFMGETLLLVLISIILSVGIVWQLLPWFNELTQKQIALSITDSSLIWSLVVLMSSVGLISGSYPSFFLSSLQPAKVLKGSISFGKKAIGFRKGLVVFQFILSILLITATIVVTRQMQFIQTKNLGYDRENILYILLEGELLNNYLTYKREVSRMPGIKLIDRSSQTPHRMGFSGPFVRWDGMDESNPINFVPSSVGYDYVKLMGMEIVEGRDFSHAFPADTNNFLVSVSAVKQMKLDDPVGSEISIFGKTGTIVGVTNDFHTQSLHQSISPVILDIKENLNFGTMLVRTEAGKTKEAIASLEKIHNLLNPGYAFSYSFLDDEYDKLYHSEQIISKLTTAFGALAIFISCLGLFGLAMFSAEQRIKEIGIRKVLGASVSSIITLFSKDFLKLVGFSFVVAIPISWFAMREWLQGFAYRIDLAWWIFAFAGALALSIALFTISFQAIKAAIANPIKSLRSE